MNHLNPLNIKRRQEQTSNKQIADFTIQNIFDTLKNKYENLLFKIQKNPENAKEISNTRSKKILEYLNKLTEDFKIDILSKTHISTEDIGPADITEMLETIHELQSRIKILLTPNNEIHQDIQQDIQVKEQTINSKKPIPRLNKYANLHSIDEWIEYAKKIGVYKMTISKILNESHGFYTKFCQWSRTQENAQALREQMFTYEEKESYINLKTIEDWIQRAKKKGVYQMNFTKVKDIEPNFYNYFCKWSKKQANTTALRYQMFADDDCGIYAKLETLEDWKERARNLGLLGQPAKKVSSTGFYQAFYRWTCRAENENREYLREQVFFYENANPYRNLKTIEDWKSMAKEIQVYKLSPTETRLRAEIFYKFFYEWTHAQINTQELREQVLSFPNQLEKSDTTPTTIEDWKEYFTNNKILYLPKSYINYYLGHAMCNQFLICLETYYTIALQKEILDEWFPDKPVKNPQSVTDWEKIFVTFHLWNKETGPTYTEEEIKNNSNQYLKDLYREFTYFCSYKGYSSLVVRKYFPQSK